MAQMSKRAIEIKKQLLADIKPHALARWAKDPMIVRAINALAQAKADAEQEENAR
jgi:hypothetical protein